MGAPLLLTECGRVRLDGGPAFSEARAPARRRMSSCVVLFFYTSQFETKRRGRSRDPSFHAY